METLQTHGDANLDKAVIVLTKQDINSSDFRLRFLFSEHITKYKLSVISTARIDPFNFGEPSNDKLTMRRLEKLIDKSLGFNLYGYPTSSDRKSVMYGPIMGLHDLDAIGESY
jgi:predicted Zn-dependent protease